MSRGERPEGGDPLDVLAWSLGIPKAQLVRAVAAVLAEDDAVQPVAKSNPCGGCGETDPAKRCIGCFHPF